MIHFSVFFLVFAEKFGDKIKNYKYYHCVTLFAYEFIWFFSILTLVYSVIKIRYIESFMQFKFRVAVDVFYLIIIGYAYWSHWTKNTFVHVSLCRREIFGVSNLDVQISISHWLLFSFPLTERAKENSVWWKFFSIA